MKQVITLEHEISTDGDLCVARGDQRCQFIYSGMGTEYRCLLFGKTWGPDLISTRDGTQRCKECLEATKDK